MVRDLIGEVVGLSPYEKRLLDMLKTGGVSSEKRMYKFAKRRVSLERIELSGRCCLHCHIYFKRMDPNLITKRSTSTFQRIRTILTSLSFPSHKHHSWALTREQ